MQWYKIATKNLETKISSNLESSNIQWYKIAINKFGNKICIDKLIHLLCQCKFYDDVKQLMTCSYKNHSESTS